MNFPSWPSLSRDVRGLPLPLSSRPTHSSICLRLNHPRKMPGLVLWKELTLMTGCFFVSLRNNLQDVMPHWCEHGGRVCFVGVWVSCSELSIEFRPCHLSTLLETSVFDCLHLPCKWSPSANLSKVCIYNRQGSEQSRDLVKDTYDFLCVGQRLPLFGVCQTGILQAWFGCMGPFNLSLYIFLTGM
jgi:hypothetical protein